MSCFKFFSAVAAGAFALLPSVASAADGDIVFHSQNHCKGNDGRRFDSEATTRANCKYNYLCRGNDVFRSVWIGLSVKPGTEIRVWDSPKGSSDDDWARIIVKKPVATRWGGQRDWNGMCIVSFEQIKSGADYEIYYRRVNGLDGKVSLVRINQAP